jgi:molecular chaperone DnaK
MKRAIGIDLGTTNSCAAVIEDNQPKVIMYRGGSFAIPSILAVAPGGELLVGDEARQLAVSHPDRAVISPKRVLGGGFGAAETDALRRLFTHSMVENEQGEVMLSIAGKVFDLTEISTRILMKIREVAEACIEDEVGGAVITVPAYFNAKQRRAIRKAGDQAGLEVLRILNEPTAAALAYGLGRDLRQRLAVFDLGGGTLDLSIIEIRNRVFEVVATGGDAFLGGLDFDDRIIRYAIEHFEMETGIDVRQDPVAVQRIRVAAERAKIELSKVDETILEVPFLARSESGTLGLDMTLSRAELEDLTGDLIDRAIEKTRGLFAGAGVEFSAIDEVLLVGGQSRMPLVRRKVRMLFQKEPCRGVHPDEAVAVGASIMAHSLSLVGDTPTISLLDALPHPIGIEQVDESFLPIFPKNCPLPHSRRMTLTNSKADQKTIMLKLFRGEEARAADNELLGTFVFSDFQPLPRGEVKLQVWISVDTDGLLSVRATERGTNLPVTVGLKSPNGLQEPVLSLTTESRRGELLDLGSTGQEQSPDPVVLERAATEDESGTESPSGDQGQLERNPTEVAPGAEPLGASTLDQSSYGETDSLGGLEQVPMAQSTHDSGGIRPISPTEGELSNASLALTPEPDDELGHSEMRSADSEAEEAELLEHLVNATRPMDAVGEGSISPIDEVGSVWDEGRDRASAGGDGVLAAAEALEGDEDIAWFELLLPWNWWK